MKNLKHLITILLAAAFTSSFAQTPGVKIDEQPYIEVTGTAIKEVVPNEIYISIELYEKYKDKVKISIEEQETKLKAALTSIGVDLSNLYLSDANADYVKVSWQKKDVITNKNYTLKVSDAATVGKVFQELDKIEITDASIEKVSHSDIENLRKEVKISAIKAAKDKADYLLAAIGETAGKPLIITENNNANYTANTYANYNISNKALENLSLNLKKENDDEIQFEKIVIQSSFYVKFSIK